MTVPRACADAIEYAIDGLDKFNTEKEVAQYLRKAFVDKVRSRTACRIPCCRP